MRAWKTPAGITFRRPANDDRQQLQLPCGGCLGCRMSKARDWAVRCALELKDHSRACWVTLTYDDKYCPPALRKDHLSIWLKRLRAREPDTTIRFFACGEYGERTQRPHFHSIIYGLPTTAHGTFEKTWRKGHVRTDPLTPAAISYVAGYVTKKQKLPLLDPGIRVDPETGEEYHYQPAFQHMSRRPGIGSSARQYWTSWRKTAIWHGKEVPVPRYLHEAYKSNASTDALETLEFDKYLYNLSRDHDPQRLEAQAMIDHAKHSRQSEKRSL